MAADPGHTRPLGDAFGSRLAAARAEVGALTAAADELGTVADGDVAAVMSELTTMVGQLDSLRVAVAGQVRQRGLYRLRGAANVAGWLRADARTADEAGLLSRLAAMTSQLPQISGLLADGSVSLAQAGTACWQISHLPPVVTRPEEADAGGPAPDEQAPDEQAPAAEPPGAGDDPWAGLWRGGDVQAAADELFAQFLPGLDGAQLRVLGAHLREAADAQERAGDDYSDFARRSLRISRTFGGIAHLTGRLHGGPSRSSRRSRNSAPRRAPGMSGLRPRGGPTPSPT